MSTPARSHRKDLVGVVASKTGDKSIKVVSAFKVRHPVYVQKTQKNEKVFRNLGYRSPSFMWWF
jgi:ribosomal protein S17